MPKCLASTRNFDTCEQGNISAKQRLLTFIRLKLQTYRFANKIQIQLFLECVFTRSVTLKSKHFSVYTIPYHFDVSPVCHRHFIHDVIISATVKKLAIAKRNRSTPETRSTNVRAMLTGYEHGTTLKTIVVNPTFTSLEALWKTAFPSVMRDSVTQIAAPCVRGHSVNNRLF